jgi:hypothetical protein
MHEQHSSEINAGEIARVAQELAIHLHETYPMYGQAYFADVDRLLGEILNAKPHNEVEVQSLVVRLGELALAVSHARQSIENGSI